MHATIYFIAASSSSSKTTLCPPSKASKNANMINSMQGIQAHRAVRNSPHVLCLFPISSLSTREIRSTLLNILPPHCPSLQRSLSCKTLSLKCCSDSNVSDTQTIYNQIRRSTSLQYGIAPSNCRNRIMQRECSSPRPQ